MNPPKGRRPALISFASMVVSATSLERLSLDGLYLPISCHIWHAHPRAICKQRWNTGGHMQRRQPHSQWQALVTALRDCFDRQGTIPHIEALYSIAHAGCSHCSHLRLRPMSRRKSLIPGLEAHSWFSVVSSQCPHIPLYHGLQPPCFYSCSCSCCSFLYHSSLWLP